VAYRVPGEVGKLNMTPAMDGTGDPRVLQWFEPVDG
jgi:hypothetical protein